MVAGLGVLGARADVAKQGLFALGNLARASPARARRLVGHGACRVACDALARHGSSPMVAHFAASLAFFLLDAEAREGRPGGGGSEPGAEEGSGGAAAELRAAGGEALLRAAATAHARAPDGVVKWASRALALLA